MAQFSDERAEQLIIESNPETRMVYQIVKQLADLLPIKSVREVSEQLKEEFIVGGKKVPLEILGIYLPEDIFPIEEIRDLVVKVSAGVRMADKQLRSLQVSGAGSDSLQSILEKEDKTDDDLTSIPAGHFRKPSIYGYTLLNDKQ